MPRFRKQVVVWVVQIVLLTGSHQILLSSQPESLPGDDVFGRFQQAIEDCHNARFSRAIKTAEELCASYPQDPAGVLALMYIYQSITDSYRVTDYMARVDSLAEIAVRLSRNAIKRDKRRGINYLCLATAYGTRSLSYARQRKWMYAFRNGKNIKRSFEKAISRDPYLYDAYYGLGVYNYWLAAKSRILSMLLTSKQEAIKQVKVAVQKGRFFKTTARYGLSAIYINEGKYGQALALCESLYQQYPNNPTLQYRRGWIYEELGE